MQMSGSLKGVPKRRQARAKAHKNLNKRKIKELHLLLRTPLKFLGDKIQGLLGDNNRDENLLDPRFDANSRWLKVAYSGIRWLKVA